MLSRLDVLTCADAMLVAVGQSCLSHMKASGQLRALIALHRYPDFQRGRSILRILVLPPTQIGRTSL